MRKAAADLLPPGTLLDGAMGTQLMARGLDLAAEAPESWNIEHPSEVRAIHASYLSAGSNAIQTNTFGANRFRLATRGLDDRVYDFNVAGAALARDAAGRNGVVIGSIGPTGTTPPPEGDANLTALEEAYAEQALALAHGGVDLLHLETAYHPKEARAAVRGCRIGAPDLPIIASLTCRQEGSIYTTGLGFAPEVLVQAFLEEGAEGIGVNCTLEPASMLDIVRMLRARTELPVIAMPTIAPTNAAPLLPGEFATGVLALHAVGADAVGGCCGTGPADIQAARHALDEQRDGHLHAASA